MKINSAPKRLQINIDNARVWGLRFCAERNSRSLSLQELADLLLLSKQQVVGLETADLKSFYSARIFAQSADKYAKYLGLDENPSDCLFDSMVDCHAPQVLLTEDSVTAEAVAVDTEVVVPISTTHKSNQSKALFIAALTAGMVLATYFATQMETRSTKPPTTTIEAATAAPSPPPASTANEAPKVENAKPEAVDDIPAGTIRIAFTGSSWVQHVDMDGNKQEKIYHTGDSLNLETGKLQALVIGNASVVTVTAAYGEINIRPYTSTGSQVARIIGVDARKLSGKASKREG